MEKHNYLFLTALVANSLTEAPNKQRYTHVSICILRRVFSFCLTSLVYFPIIGQSGYISGSPGIAYWELGSKSELVIVLHGGPGAEHSYLRPEFDRLKKTARIIYYDQRGCGKSGLARMYTWQEHVKDLKRVIEQHAGGKKVFLASSSWGSFLALLYAYTYPDDLKGLLLSGLVNWRGKGIGKEKIDLYYKDLTIKDPVQQKPVANKGIMKEHQLIEKKTKDGKIIEELVEIEKPYYIYTGQTYNHVFMSLQFAPVLDSLRQIKIPTLIFNGSESCYSFEEVREYRDVLPNCALITVKGACHDPWFANPQLFFEVSNKFIKNRSKTLRKLRKHSQKMNR